MRVGSESSSNAFWDAFDETCHEDTRDKLQDLTLLIPPLDEAGLRRLAERFPEFCKIAPEATHVAVNDLGTLVTLASALDADGQVKMRIVLTTGNLLARLDDPEEVERFLLPDENPSRPVYDLAGRPRRLTYAAPPKALVEHWRSPSTAEPSAQAAIESLTGMRIPYEFSC